ncbi:Endoribonuclease L-PSP/chorismate mutase-like protein [Jimgerdemannia flammicorona]|uniref:Endoribonuclease L-PSP/chorismate mutase-like protein n=1 Tax=Jimgerdemannia flammicorona TaxID=994334 RepID=A0A433D3F4_9FUNG|nr:Endoribonuclease L-PSP/chorismate mutase-like protein [Jimgerdemannia flammicorona]
MSSANGQPLILKQEAQPLAHYPHARVAGGLIFVSGISSRRLDNTYEGVTYVPDGTFRLDIRAQTKAVLENIKLWHSIDEILQSTGASLKNVVDLTVFLVDMEDYAAFNEVYNTFFSAETGKQTHIIYGQDAAQCMRFHQNYSCNYQILTYVAIWFVIDLGPSRTTVAVKELPSPKLLIEIKATALASV